MLQQADSYPCLHELHPIPATVISVGALAGIPYHSYGNDQAELNVYGDPDSPAAVEVGTRLESDEVKQCLFNFMGNVAPEAARGPLSQGMGLQPGVTRFNSLQLEVTPSTASDAYGAWWVTLSAPQLLAEHRGEHEDVTHQPSQWVAPAPRRTYSRVFVPPRPIRPPSPRVYAPRFQRRSGVYVRIF